MSLDYYQGKNQGSLSKIYIVRQDYASFVHLPSLTRQDTIAENISVAEDWTEIEFLPSSARWQEQQSQSDAGPTWSYTIECVINRDRAAINALLRAFAGRKLLLLAADRNGNTVRLVGNDDKKVLMSYSQLKEGGGVGPNIYRLTFNCDHLPCPAPVYTGTISGA